MPFLRSQPSFSYSMESIFWDAIVGQKHHAASLVETCSHTIPPPHISLNVIPPSKLHVRS